VIEQNHSLGAVLLSDPAHNSLVVSIHLVRRLLPEPDLAAHSWRHPIISLRTAFLVTHAASDI
jgi:hypothetical protein